MVRALVAGLMVVGFSLGFATDLRASCGDYLQHNLVAGRGPNDAWLTKADSHLAGLMPLVPAVPKSGTCLTCQKKPSESPSPVPITSGSQVSDFAATSGDRPEFVVQVSLGCVLILDEKPAIGLLSKPWKPPC
jgi:hypothetical protein